MSSIAAVCFPKGAFGREVMDRMLAASPHRGVPATILEWGNVSLGVTETNTGWSSVGNSGNWAVAIHGPIDNKAEFGDPLTNPDVGTLVASLFSKFGADAVDRLRGAFAGVATDGERLVCFRDHLGSKPLFYRQDSDWSWAATEAKQVVAGAAIRREPNLEAIQQMFYGGTSKESALKGIWRVFPGQYVVLISNQDPAATWFWNPDGALEALQATRREAVDMLRLQIEAAVTRTVSGADAVALSGGIDSTTIAAFAAPEHLRRSKTPLRAYTAVYPRHGSVNEWEYTKVAAEFLGIPVTRYEPTAGSLDDVEYWVEIADGPWDSTPMATLFEGMRLASSLGARQVLTGTLAEYVFTINRFLLGHLFLRGRWGALGRVLEARRQAGRSLLSLGKQLAREITPAPAAQFYASLARRPPTFYPPWMDPVIAGTRKYWTPLYNPARQRWVAPTLGATRGMSSTQEAIEICSSIAGVTVRQPLADRDLWEFFLSVPAEIKFIDVVPKGIIRDAMRGRLPDSILDRRDKTVFDEYVLDSTPWTRIADLIDDPDYRMAGIDYRLLQDRIEGRSARASELVWAHNLAIVHAFIKSFK
jgi:asparagine synthase (glutamine-hydrolysing)